MKVVCAWCQKSLPDKAPLEDLSVSHGICPKCAKAFEGEIEKNPNGVPRYDIATYVSQEGWKPLGRKNVLAYGRKVGSLSQFLQKEALEWRVLFTTRAETRMLPVLSLGTYKNLDMALIAANRQANDWMKNPGAAWHGRKEVEADQQDRHAKKRAHKDFFHGKSVAHLESGLAARAMQMNPLAVFTVGNPKRRRARRRPSRARHRPRRSGEGRFSMSAVFAGKTKPVRKNPLTRINVGVAGIVYNRALEIRAEKTQYKAGLYKHSFDSKSRVEVLALDNGDLLLHSTVGVRLWGQA